jgi:hypothetical protein
MENHHQSIKKKSFISLFVYFQEDKLIRDMTDTVGKGSSWMKSKICFGIIQKDQSRR